MDALAGLIEDGLATAYLLEAGIRDPFSGELPGMPCVDVPETEIPKTYFYITPKGMDLHMSDDGWWPFDDDGKLLPSWRLDGSKG